MLTRQDLPTQFAYPHRFRSHRPCNHHFILPQRHNHQKKEKKTMTIVPASRLSRAEMRILGNNVVSSVSKDRAEVAVLPSSLATPDECVEELSAPADAAPWVGRAAVA